MWYFKKATWHLYARLHLLDIQKTGHSFYSFFVAAHKTKTWVFLNILNKRNYHFEKWNVGQFEIIVKAHLPSIAQCKHMHLRILRKPKFFNGKYFLLPKFMNLCLWMGVKRQHSITITLRHLLLQTSETQSTNYP